MGPQILPVLLGWDEGVSVLPHKRRSLLVLTSHVLSQPILADEVQTFKALITIHKVLQEGHPIVLREAQANVNWLDSLSRGSGGGEGVRGLCESRTCPSVYPTEPNEGYGPIIREYIHLIEAKLAFHRNHTDFNGELASLHNTGKCVCLSYSGTFDYEEYISLKSINDPNEGYSSKDAFPAIVCNADSIQL